MVQSRIKSTSISFSRKGSSMQIDACVGRRIRQRRQEKEMSQEQLASLLGVTFQQVQKYEKGVNRVSASRLWDISRILEVSIGYFFEQVPPELSAIYPGDFALPVKVDPMEKPETVKLIQAYYQIPDRHQAKIVHDIVIAMAQSNPGTDE